jgi:hypothetical protein
MDSHIVVIDANAVVCVMLVVLCSGELGTFSEHLIEGQELVS